MWDGENNERTTCNIQRTLERAWENKKDVIKRT